MLRYVSLYQNTKDGAVLVQRCGRHPIGAVGELGDPVVLRAPELENRLVPEVQKALNEFDSPPYERSLIKVKSDPEYRQFRREHKMISITQTEEGCLEVHPCRHEKGGYVSIDAKKNLLRDHDSETLHSAILKAFSDSE